MNLITNFFKDLTKDNITNGFIAFLFAVTGPVAIMLLVGTKTQLTNQELSSWLFGAFAINSIISIVFTFWYKQPLVFMWSIPGIILIGSSIENYSFNEIIGAYLVTGILLIFLGFTSILVWINKKIPIEIVMGMVGAIFLQFSLNWLFSIKESPILSGSMTIAYFLIYAIPFLRKFLPPLLGSLVVGIIIILNSDNIDTLSKIEFIPISPTIFIPEFNLNANIEIVIPLAITVLFIQNGQGLAILKTAGHKTFLKPFTVACGFGSIINSFFGTVSSCLTGPVTGIIVSEDQNKHEANIKEANNLIGEERANYLLKTHGKETIKAAIIQFKKNEIIKTHYTGAIIFSLLCIVFGIFSPFFTGFITTCPPAFISTLGGIALLLVLKNTFIVAFSGNCSLGALIAFLITMSDLVFLNIGSPFWGLIGGVVVAKIFDKK
ncbi:benzoate/H(+) symporter BenE family transporter [Alphaproteobacteria bacterium]|nr:benzoate/H(+) symporter BenE family transporter [Alphaproteobacteria bacterium]